MQRHGSSWRQRDGRPVVTRSAAPLEPARMLLAVANSGIRWKLCERFREQGFAVYATGDARVALDWVATRPLDVVVADLLLPGTHIALPHVVRRRGRQFGCPKLIGLAAPDACGDDVRTALGYDLVVETGTPAAVLTRAVFDLLSAEELAAARSIGTRSGVRGS
jgi:hypothetical protein